MGAVESVTDHEAHPNYDETKHTVRIVCLTITLISNISLFFFMIYKIFIKKEKKLNIILGMAMYYISCTIFASFYNLLYRFTIKLDGCPRSDVFEELLIAFVRSILLLFYVIMIQKIFANSKQAIRMKVIYAFVVVIITIHMILLPSIYISQQTYYALKTPSYGIYCRNDTSASTVSFATIIIYQLTDAGITITLMVMFVIKLRKLLLYLNEKEDDIDKQTDGGGDEEDVNDEDANNDNINDERAEEQKQVVRKTHNKLLKLVKKSMTLTFVSVISSWIIIFAGRIDSESATPLRWCYPLDYLFNAWCIFLLFDWKEFVFCDCGCFDGKQDDDDQTRRRIEIAATSTTSKNEMTTTVGSEDVEQLSADNNEDIDKNSDD